MRFMRQDPRFHCAHKTNECETLMNKRRIRTGLKKEFRKPHVRHHYIVSAIVLILLGILELLKHLF